MSAIKLLLFTCSSVLVCNDAAVAQLKDCRIELMRAETKVDLDEEHYLSLASMLSKEEYNRKRQEVGAQGVIYGLPVSGNYESYKENVNREIRSLNIINFRKRAISYATSAVDQNGLDAYKVCLSAAKGGLTLVADTEKGQTSYRVHVVYGPADGEKGSKSLNCRVNRIFVTRRS